MMIIGFLLVVLGISVAIVTEKKRAIIRIPSLAGFYLSTVVGAILITVDLIKEV